MEAETPRRTESRLPRRFLAGAFMRLFEQFRGIPVVVDVFPGAEPHPKPFMFHLLIQRFLEISGVEDIVDAQVGVGLVRRDDLHASQPEQLLKQRAGERGVHHPVQQDIVDYGGEQAGFQFQLFVAEGVRREGEGQSKKEEPLALRPRKLLLRLLDFIRDTVAVFVCQEVGLVLVAG